MCRLLDLGNKSSYLSIYLSISVDSSLVDWFSIINRPYLCPAYDTKQSEGKATIKELLGK